MSIIFNKENTLKKIEKLGFGKHDSSIHHDRINELIDIVNLLIDRNEVLIKEIEHIKLLSKDKCNEFSGFIDLEENPPF